MSALGIAAGVVAVILLCALSYWIGTRVQARRDFKALESALRPVGDADICGGMSDALSAETTALRKDLDDVLDALRHLRSCQHRPPIIDGDSEAWWRAAVDEADLLLTRFAIPTVQQESDHWGIP